jgi:outer membrane protein assembly factor BamB
LYEYAAITDGVAFAAVDSTFNAYDLQSGHILWSYAGPSGDYFPAGPVVVPSGVYVCDIQGWCYAFKLGGSASPKRMRSR